MADDLVSPVDRMLDCITADVIFASSASTPKVAYRAADYVECQD